MRNILALVGALALTVAWAGWYLGWFRLSSGPTATGQRGVTINIDTEKIGQDLHRAEQGLQKKIAEKVKPAPAADNAGKTEPAKKPARPEEVNSGEEIIIK